LLLSFFISHNLVDLAWVLISPALLMGPYYHLTLMRMPFGQLYLAALGVTWWCSGMAYLVSAIVPQQVRKGGREG
jgi:hypothetical protein